MQKIKDERLVLKNLKNIRVAFFVQTIGIIGILGYDLITKGMDEMTSNPLWFVFIVTGVVSAYLSMNISVEHENDKKNPRKGFGIGLSVLLLICVAILIFVALTDGFGIGDGLFIAGIFFVCGIAPLIYIYFLRKKNKEE